MKIRTLIVDDEPLARERVRVFAEEEPDLEVAGECGDGAAAVEAIEALRPELVFLDVQMPRLNGFEVLEAIDVRPWPVVIFVTAHDTHALRAFEVSATDYLLKPYAQARFRKAVERARLQLKAIRSTGADGPEQGPGVALQALLEQVRPTGRAPRILVRTPDRIVFLKPEEVDHVEAAGNYLVLHAGKERHIVRETMTAMEARLSPAGFLRANRSALINLRRIREVQPLPGGDHCVILQSGARISLTCPLRELQARLDLL